MLSTMRQSRNKQESVYIFKMVNVKSVDYPGTETKIDLVGSFDCVVRRFTKSKNKDDNKSKNDVIAELEVPKGYHFQPGYMASFDSAEKPNMMIKAVTPFTSHCLCELVSWT